MLDPINVKYFRFAVGSEIGKETPNDISAKCVICGDSEKDPRQKRLHLYRKSSYESDAIHCFNCGYTGNMYTFLRDVNSNLFEQYKKEKRETSFNKLKKERDDTNDIIPIEFSYKAKKLKTFEIPKQFINASEVPRAKEYLLGRKVNPSDFFYCEKGFELEGKFLPLKDTAIIPLWYEREKSLYGFQARSIEGKTFYTYIPEENSGMKIWTGAEYDTHGDVILIAESVFDALSMGFKKENVGAVLGISENSYFEEHYKKVIYCLDNQRKDPTSMENSKKLLKQGKTVFVWPKGIQEKDFNAMVKNGVDPKEIKSMIINNTYSGLRGISKLL